MNGIWLVQAFNTYDYDSNESDMVYFYNKLNAENAFYDMCSKYLDDDREYVLEELTLNGQVTYEEIKKMGKDVNLFLDYGYEYSYNDKYFTIRRDDKEKGTYEEVIIRMIYLKEGVAKREQLFTINSDEESVTDFFKFLLKRKR